MTRSRVKIWDPPVGFTFKKNSTYLRSDFASGTFHSLSRFQAANQLDPNARKSFTLSLSSPTSTGVPGDPIVLQPGESKTFSTWVEKNWTWGFENSSGEFAPRSFFDWNANSQFTNRDNRTSNNFGVEAISSTSPFLGDPRAGFQTDCLSYFQNARPANTLYDFEATDMRDRGWVAIKLNDTISVETKPILTSPFPSLSYFVVEQLKGENQDASSDIARQFRMNQADIVDKENPIISRTFLVADILQAPTDTTPGGKSPFAKFTMIAKLSALRTNRFFASPAAPGNNLYELQFGEAADFVGLNPSKPSDASPDAPPVVHGISRSGNTLFIDFSGASNNFGINPWKLRGTSSLADGFNDNLDSATTVAASTRQSSTSPAAARVTS